MSTKFKINAADERINLRIDPKVKAILAKAAKESGSTLTEFMVASAKAAADDVLANRTLLVLSPKDWRKFNELLDAPAREIPALRRLFKERSVFEK